MNIGFDRGFAGSTNFSRGQISGSNSRSKRVPVGAYKNTDELRLSVGLVKSLNVASLNERTFAYHFIERAPGVVTKNLFRLFDAVLDVLVERFDNDMCKDTDEYNCAVVAKRIQDALGTYKAP